ncbi:hypothetical protein ACOI1C_18825 [Bacillus sp. DJP31]|uniref:hypothetical protein n=1 Tax=Bacillus sp. DJP31 TaxID=3409789 RepID=UPI003BB4C258
MLAKVFRYLKGKREVVHAFHESAHYMAAGLYEFDKSIKYIRRKDPVIKDRASMVLQESEYKKRSKLWLIYLLKQTIFRKALSISRSDLHTQEFIGQVYLPFGSANGYRDRKIFDLENNKVLTIYLDKKGYHTVLTDHDLFREYFPMPTIIWADDQQLTTIEELISFHPVNQWKEEDLQFVMEDIFIRSFYYFNECLSKRVYSFTTAIDIINTLPNREEVNFIKNKINPDLLELEIPVLTLHGDLWAANTLLVKGKTNQVKYIDWEFSNEFTFFYDFFMMMWLDVYMKNRFELINSYVNGDYDQHFKRIFSLFYLTFASKYRMDYFHLFFLNFFKERLVHFSEADQQVYFLQYKRLVETLEQ